MGKMKDALRKEAERIAASDFPILKTAYVENAIHRVMPDFMARELTRSWQDLELARNERVLLCLFAASLYKD